jgi:hypothetical protein
MELRLDLYHLYIKIVYTHNIVQLIGLINTNQFL